MTSSYVIKNPSEPASLKQTDYKIKLVSVAGGTLKLKDELKFSFDIAAQSERG